MNDGTTNIVIRLSEESKMAKETQIVSIVKIESNADYCRVRVNDGKFTRTHKRRIYQRTKKGPFTGKFIIAVDYEVYTFEWAEDGTGKNITWIGNAEHKTFSEVLNGYKTEDDITVKIEEVIEDASQDQEIYHEKFQMILTCVEKKIPVYLAGPAGSGKNHTLEQIAKKLNLEFYFTNSVQQEYKITGFIDAGGVYHETEFYKAFTNGGLFFLDEMDASIAEVLVLLNAAIANGYFEFPNGKVTAHEDFRVVAAGNTVGSGADEMYTGRLVLDQATLDRFCIIEFDYSKKIELALAKNNGSLVDFIRDIRKQAEEKGIRATFSYRCISMVVKLEGKIEMTEILNIAVFKGMTKDTVKTFTSYDKGNNPYFKALSQLKEAM